MSNIKFAISSHINYITKTENIIVDSLLSSGIPKNDIYIFIGGKEPDSGYTEVGTNKFLVPHNSMDFTALISIIELDLQNDFWFLLHDTCRAGENFYSRLMAFDHSDKNYIALIHDASMNIGSYHWNHIQSNKEQILLYKNIDYHNSNLQKFKLKMIHAEDIFITPKIHCYCTNPRHTSSGVDYYNSGSTRIIEYFPDIDLYKMKANWHLKPEYIIVP